MIWYNFNNLILRFSEYIYAVQVYYTHAAEAGTGMRQSTDCTEGRPIAENRAECLRTGRSGGGARMAEIAVIFIR